MEQKSIHTGHRKRMKEHFQKTGGLYLTEHQLLELTLFYSVPRSDTNPLAHRLLDRFGSLSGVVSAPPEALMEETGVGLNTLALLKLIDQLVIRYQESIPEDGSVPLTPKGLERYFRTHCLHLRDKLYVLCLDDRGCRLSLKAQDSKDSPFPLPDVKFIVAEAADTRAQEVVLVIPRMGARELPSARDLEDALRCERALSTLSVGLRDVLFFSQREWVSLRKMRLLH